MRVKIHHEGTNILLILLAVIVAINLPLWLWVRPFVWAIVSTVLFGVFYLLVVNFYRTPRNQFYGDRKNVVVASADD